MSKTSQQKRSLEVEAADVNETCSLQDVIDYEKETCEMASAVLGASDPTNCSYASGYVYRQALYSCLTCLAEKKSTLGPGEIDQKLFFHGTDPRFDNLSPPSSRNLAFRNLPCVFVRLPR